MYGQVRVKGYSRKDGTYVQPHVRSNPDGNPFNNWSTKGNVNPYTGELGTKNIALENGYDCIEISNFNLQNKTVDASIQILPKRSVRTEDGVRKSAIIMVFFEKEGLDTKEFMSLKNELVTDVSEVTIRLAYFLDNGEPLDYRDIRLYAKIPSGLARKFVIESFDQERKFVFKNGLGFKSNYTPFTIKYEILDYK